MPRSSACSSSRSSCSSSTASSASSRWFGLAIYASLYYAAILLFHVTLTLPGFAGLILTIGVAADANVVVFERIKEEVRAGKSVRAAIAAGYGKGFHTILDANVVTRDHRARALPRRDRVGQGLRAHAADRHDDLAADRGAATRAPTAPPERVRWFDNPRFMGAQGQQTAKWLQIDFMKRRKVWLAMSAVIIIAGSVSLGVRGLNLGIDFKGGRADQLQHAQGLHDDGDRQHREGSGAGGRRRPGQRRVDERGVHQLAGPDSLAIGQRAEHVPAGSRAAAGAYKLGTTNVSSSFGHQIAIDAIWGSSSRCS